MRAFGAAVIAVSIILSIPLTLLASHEATSRVDCRIPERVGASRYGRLYFGGNEQATVKPHESSVTLVHLEGMELRLKPFTDPRALERLRFVINPEFAAHWDVHDLFSIAVVGLYPLDGIGRIGNRLCVEVGTAWETNLGSIPKPSHGRHNSWIGARYRLLEDQEILGKPLQIDSRLRFFIDSDEPLAVVKNYQDGREIHSADTLRANISFPIQWQIKSWAILWAEPAFGFGNRLFQGRLVSEGGIRFPINKTVEVELGARYSRPLCKDAKCVSTQTGWLGVRLNF